MDIVITPSPLSGSLRAIPSKSQAHRLLICAAFAKGNTTLLCPETNRDIEATAACLRALGADIRRTESGYAVIPVSQIPRRCTLPCGESGSTLRFMLPIAGALGCEATFLLEGRLPQRPLSPLWEEMERMGCVLSRPSRDTLLCRGKLRSGTYEIAGNVSSQFITGLLLAFPLMEGQSQVRILGKLESKPYVDMTKQVLSLFGTPPVSPGTVEVEGDWSNGAFFLAAKALGSDVNVTGLDPDSCQGDRAAAALLMGMERPQVIDATDIPDLVPILAVAAGGKHGAVFENISRLRLKESDRVASTMAMLKALGVRSEADENTLRVFPGKFTGGTVDACRDHRIAMAAAIAATVADGPVEILGAECVEKSYPRFWEEYKHLGGRYELLLR